jgi:hypothetical protein
MTICDLCKKDPIATAANEALKAAPWGVALMPPPGSGLPDFRLCMRCSLDLFQKLLVLIALPEA